MDFPVDPMVDHRFLHSNMSISWYFVAFDWPLIVVGNAMIHPWFNHSNISSEAVLGAATSCGLQGAAAELVELVESFSALLSGSMELFSWYIEKIIFASTMESDWRDCEQLGVANEVLNDYNEVRSGCWSFWHVTFGSGCGFQFQWNNIFWLPSQKVSRFETHWWPHW